MFVSENLKVEFIVRVSGRCSFNRRDYQNYSQFVIINQPQQQQLKGLKQPQQQL